jgi:hypothetical protein
MERHRQKKAILWINTDAKDFNEIVANQIQYHIKGILCLIKWDLSLGFKDGSPYKNHYDISH